MAEAQGGGVEGRAAAYVNQAFMARQLGLILDHRRQEQRQLAYHKGQLQSHGQNQADAEQRHWQKIRSLDQQQEREARALDKQQRGIGGRLAGLTKAGRVRQAEQREVLADKFDRARMVAHRDLEALKEREVLAQQADRLARARELKLFRQDHQDARLQQARQYEQTRPRQIQERVQALQRVADQEKREQTRERPDLRQAFDREQQRQGRTRSGG